MPDTTQTHNESRADRNSDGPELTSIKSGRTGANIDISFPVKYLYFGSALVVGVILGKKVNTRLIATKAAQKAQVVAEQAEEAAVRG